MGLVATGVNITSADGDVITDFFIRVDRISLIEKPSTQVRVELTPFRSEAALDGGSQRLRLNPQDVPNELRVLSLDITPAQYANLDSLAVKNQLVGLLEDGDSDPLWSQIPEIQFVSWSGLGTGTVTVSMPA